MRKEGELQKSSLDLSVDGIDIAIDLLNESELLKDVPVAGFIYKLGKTLSSIPDAIFLHKVARFIQTVNQKTTREQRIKFAEELKNNKEKRDKLYSAIFLRIDKFDDISKSDLFAKIFACFIKNKIRKEDYDALASALNLASIEELVNFSNFYWKRKNPFHTGFSRLPEPRYESLLSTCLAKIDLNSKILRQTSSPSTLTYELKFKITELGYLYIYISQDFENHFSVMKDSERNYRNQNSLYSFEAPSIDNEIGQKVQQKWPISD